MGVACILPFTWWRPGLRCLPLHLSCPLCNIWREITHTISLVHCMYNIFLAGNDLLPATLDHSVLRMLVQAPGPSFQKAVYLPAESYTKAFCMFIQGGLTFKIYLKLHFSLPVGHSIRARNKLHCSTAFLCILFVNGYFSLTRGICNNDVFSSYKYWWSKDENIYTWNIWLASQTPVEWTLASAGKKIICVLRKNNKS